MNHRPIKTTPCPALQALAMLIGVAFASAALAQGVASDKGTIGTTATSAYVPDPVATTSRALSGKLFFTDAKRAQLNKARKDGVQIVNEEVVYRTTVLNGFVKRSDGSTTYWVNGGRQGNTRYVVAHDGSVLPSSAMVGPEPKVFLSGSSIGAARAVDDTKDNPHSSGQSNASKTKAVKKKAPVQTTAKKRTP